MTERGKCRGRVVYASLFGVGAPEALVIGVVALLVFGPKGLAEVARNFGNTLRAFQPTIRQLQEVSREFKVSLEREIGCGAPPPPTLATGLEFGFRMITYVIHLIYTAMALITRPSQPHYLPQQAQMSPEGHHRLYCPLLYPLRGIPMEEVPEVDRGEGSRARDVPQATSAPAGGDSGVVTAALAQMMQVMQNVQASIQAQQEAIQTQLRIMMEFIQEQRQNERPTPSMTQSSWAQEEPVEPVPLVAVVRPVQEMRRPEKERLDIKAFQEMKPPMFSDPLKATEEQSTVPPKEQQGEPTLSPAELLISIQTGKAVAATNAEQPMEVLTEKKPESTPSSDELPQATHETSVGAPPLQKPESER
ncbi:hypothetical protein ACLOJK_003792 [Asimina triloba]